MARRTRSCFIAAALATILALGVGERAMAQSFAPVAVVNDQIITGYDVAQRARLMSIASGGSETVGTDTALDALIEDTLRIQAARRAGIDPSQDEVRAGFDEISRLNKRDPEQMRSYFRSQGVSDEALDMQMKAEVAWRQLIRQRYGNRSRVSQEEVQQAVAQGDVVTPAAAQTVYRLSQLVVPLDPNAPQSVADAAMAQANAVRGQLTSCADVEARKAGYHKISGDVGSMSLASMPDPVRNAVSGLEAGQITQPVRSNDGIHVIVVCEKNTAEAKTPADDQILQAAQTLQAERLARYAKSLLRDLRRDAVIEKR